MPIVGGLMKGVSTAKRSGRTLADLLLGKLFAQNGVYVEFARKHLAPSALARDETRQDFLIRDSSALCDELRKQPT
jgi:hypothetical protein